MEEVANLIITTIIAISKVPILQFKALNKRNN